MPDICQFGAAVPFTFHWVEYEVPSPVNGPRGAAAHPFAIPAAPQGNRCFALRSPTTPACGTAKLDILSRFASIRHPWRIDLVFRATARRFPAGTTPFQSHWFLLLTKRPHGFWWRLNRRSVSRRPGQPTGMWAEGAVHMDVNSRPTRSRRE